jgi:hypothetical protein
MCQRDLAVDPGAVDQDVDVGDLGEGGLYRVRFGDVADGGDPETSSAVDAGCADRGSRSSAMTRIPGPDSRSAQARPMPLPAPVTTIVRSSAGLMLTSGSSLTVGRAVDGVRHVGGNRRRTVCSCSSTE